MLQRPKQQWGKTQESYITFLFISIAFYLFVGCVSLWVMFLC